MHPDTMDPALLEEEELDDEMDESASSSDVDSSPRACLPYLANMEEDEEEEEEDDDEDMEVQPCLLCAALFTARRDLRAHVRAKHLGACAWTCRSCGAVFPDVEAFKSHLVKVHKLSKELFALDEPEANPLLRPCLTIPQDVRPCPEDGCGAEFSSLTSLNLHRLRRHISKRLTQNVPCPVCAEDAADLTAHVRQVHGIDGVVCPHCAKILSKTCTLNRHIEQVHLNLQIHRPATCDQCGKVFSKKGHLDRHVRTIHLGMKEASEPCPYCGKIFSTKSSLDPHIEMVHRGVRKECPECGKVLSDLWKHMRTVHGFYRRRAKIPKEALDLSAEVLQQQASPDKPKKKSSSVKNGKKSKNEDFEERRTVKKSKAKRK